MTQVLLTDAQKDKVQLLTGHSYFTTLTLQQLSNYYNQVAVDRVDEIILELADIDTQLKELRPDSLALEVQNMKLSFPQQRAILKQDGSNLLMELCQILAITPVYNKYKSSSCSQPHYW